MHGEPRPLHASSQAGHNRGAADEGSGQGGEATEADGEVGRFIYLLTWV